MNRPTAPAPAIATRTASPLLGRGRGRRRHVADRSRHRGDVDGVFVLHHRVRPGQHPGAEPHDERDPAVGRLLELAHRVAHPLLVQRQRQDRDRAARLAPGRGDTVGQQHPHQAVRAPRHGGHGRDTEALVDRSALRVVDPGDDPLDAEGLPGDPGRDDVGVVTAGDRGEGVGLLRAGFDEDLAVEALPDDLAPAEVRAEAATVNLGRRAGLTVASALLVDYTLTVAVSISAAAANVGALVPLVAEHKVAFAVVAIGLLTAVNLRGIRESGAAFAVPVYAFMIAIGTMIVWGLTRVLLLGDEVRAASADLHLLAEGDAF